MSEAIRRHDLRVAGGREVSVSVSGNTITAVLEFREMADMKRGRGKLVNRGWTVVKTSGMSVKVTANIN